VRWAALTAVQHQPVKKWANRALKEKNHGKRVALLLGLAKVTGIDPANRQPTDPPLDQAMAKKIFQSLGQVDWDQLNEEQRLTLVRAYQVALVRFGKPDDRTAQGIVKQLDPHFPAPTFDQNWLLCETLAFLQAPSTATKGMKLLLDAPTQEEQIEYARSLRMLKTGWNKKLRTAFFNWFLKASNYRGGASFSKFIEFIRNDAVASLSKAEQTELKALLAKKPESKTPFEIMAKAMIGRKYVKPWKLEELSEATSELKRRNFKQGRKMFAAGGCFACHRFGNEGGMTGPDLTGAGGRYSSQDLLEQIINPSKEINEQFVPTVVKMKNGDVVTGVVVNLSGDRVTLNTDMFDPNQRVNVNRPDIASIGPSTVSPMPPGLLNMMQKDEIMDLVAYILSGGDRKHEAFLK
jgi:putative heme-binding domain-containing protein